MLRAFSTEQVPPERSLRWWQEALSEVYYNLEVYSPHSEGIRGKLTEYDIGSVSLSRFVSEEQRVFRTRARIAMDGDDSFVIVMPDNGPMFYSQAGRSGFRQPGQHVLVSTQHFYELSSPDNYSNLTVKVPGALLRQKFPQAEDHLSSAYTADPNLVSIFRSFAKWMVEQHGIMPEQVAQGFSDQLIDLLVAVLESEKRGGEDCASPAVVGLRQRIGRYLTERLCDPELTPARVAETFGISPSYLHRVFRPAGMPIGRWITAHRLQRGYEMLALPRYAGHSVAQIAYAVGFTSQAHFSEAFRRQFGVTPSTVRSRARQGLLAPAWGDR